MRLGLSLNADGSNMPLEAQLKGYRAAQWTGFAFAMLGRWRSHNSTRMFLSAAVALVLSVLLFRDVGIIGGKGEIKLLEDEKSVSSEVEGTVVEMTSYSYTDRHGP